MAVSKIAWRWCEVAGLAGFQGFRPVCQAPRHNPNHQDHEGIVNWPNVAVRSWDNTQGGLLLGSDHKRNITPILGYIIKIYGS